MKRITKNRRSPLRRKGGLLALGGATLMGIGLLTIALMQFRPTPLLSQKTSTDEAEVSEETKVKVLEAYGKLPLSFEANEGQTDERVNFLSRGSGYTLFLTSTEAVLALSKPTKKSKESMEAIESMGSQDSQDSPDTYFCRNRMFPNGFVESGREFIGVMRNARTIIECKPINEN